MKKRIEALHKQAKEILEEIQHPPVDGIKKPQLKEIEKSMLARIEYAAKNKLQFTWIFDEAHQTIEVALRDSLGEPVEILWAQPAKPTASELMKTKIIEWMATGDTGISSKTMAFVAAGVSLKQIQDVDGPHDPSDFGRCYRLVKKVPEIKEHFPVIAKKVKVFAPIIKHWDEIVALYEEELPLGRGPKTYEKIKTLRGYEFTPNGMKPPAATKKATATKKAPAAKTKKATKPKAAA